MRRTKPNQSTFTWITGVRDKVIHHIGRYRLTGTINAALLMWVDSTPELRERYQIEANRLAMESEDPGMAVSEALAGSRRSARNRARRRSVDRETA